jgi:hypothetical protein
VAHVTATVSRHPLNHNAKNITLIKGCTCHSELTNIFSCGLTEIVGAAVRMTTLANLIPLIKFYETKNDA